MSPLSQSSQSSLDTNTMQQVKFIPVNEEDVQSPKYILAKPDSAKNAHVQPINIAQHIKYGKDIILLLCKYKMIL